MHQLLASPFLGQYLVVRPGQPATVRIPEARYEELCAGAAEDRPVPEWLRQAAAQAWSMSLPDTTGLRGTVLVRERSTYGYAKASWEINLGCDYDCQFCYLGEKRFEGLTWEDKRRLLEMIRDAGVLWLQITGGEALIDPQFAPAYQYAHEIGLMVQVSTNGSQLHKQRMIELFEKYPPYRVTVSLYGATAETYEKVTKNRGAYERFVRGLDAAREAGLPMRLNIVLSDDNAHEVDAMVAMAERYGFRHQVYSSMSPTIDGEADPLALQAAEKYVRPRSVFTGCNAGHTFFHVDPHGVASICKVGRDPNVCLMAEGLEALPRLGAIAESLQLRTGGCSGCTKVGTCRTCRPLAKLYQDAGDDRSLYCRHGGYGS